MGRYMILKGVPLEYDVRSDDNHVFIHSCTEGKHYSLAINVQSNAEISRLYYCIRTYHLSELSNELGSKQAAWLQYFSRVREGLRDPFELPSEIKGKINYQRDAWFLAEEMQPAEPDMSQIHRIQTSVDLENNELAKKLVNLIWRIQSCEQRFLVAAGVVWGPKKEKDWTFGFYPALGLHDIHENENGSDGALFFFEPDKDRVTGVFMLFQAVEGGNTNERNL